MSSDDFDVVIEAMLEAPFRKKEKRIIGKGQAEENSRSGSRGRGPDSLHRRTPRRDGHRRRGRRTRGRGRRRDRGGRHRTDRRRHRRCRSHSRIPRCRSRSLSRDRVYGRSPGQRDACTVLCLQFPAQTRPSDLEHFFSSVGKVRDVKIISDRSSRRSKGIAYVEFYNMASVSRAIGLSGRRLLGAPILIQASQGEKNRPAGGLGPPPRGGAGPGRLHVGSLHPSVTQDMLRAICCPFGKIDSLHLIRDPETGLSKGYGFVTFAESDCARRALEQLNGFELAGRPLRVGPVSERPEQEPPGSVLDSEDTERSGISLGPSGRLQLMARLAQGSGLEIPPATQAALQLRNIYPFGILMPSAAGATPTQGLQLRTDLPGTVPTWEPRPQDTEGTW